MPVCPQCSKPLVEMTRQCPFCRADLDLLVEYVQGLRGSLSRAENLTRAGDLGQAVWAYLEILEVDPDNPEARRQVGQIATAVRQFDRTIPGRRWAQGMPAEDDRENAGWSNWLKIVVAGLAVITAFGLGFAVGNGQSEVDQSPPEQKQDQQQPKPKPRPDSLTGK